ncbi:hypothetical protein [Rhodococcus sp. LB1]|uniref:hypothetical protein n=1 Tax=Rhodococcus sp. LB1 TaxID=1807499 RepID=UPI000ACB5819|nr:hypothetical protein [Rhodococcus sp. LB1]
MTIAAARIRRGGDRQGPGRLPPVRVLTAVPNLYCDPEQPGAGNGHFRGSRRPGI